MVPCPTRRLLEAGAALEAALGFPKTRQVIARVIVAVLEVVLT